MERQQCWAIFDDEIWNHRFEYKVEPKLYYETFDIFDIA